MIYFDPSQRPTAADALGHAWLSTYHDEADEPVCPRVFDRWRLIEKLETLEEYRDALAKEVKDCRREMRNLAALSPPLGGVQEEREASPALQVPSSTEPEGRSITPAEDRITRTRRATISRRPSMDPTPEEAVAFPSPGDPVVAYSRRSIFGQPSRTNSTFSVHRQGSPGASEPQGNSTVAFPTTDYVVPGRHRTASMYTVGDGSDGGHPEVRRLLRTLSTVSIYESGEGLAGGLADVAPIGKYIVQKERTGDEALASEMPKDILGEESESPSAQLKNGEGADGKRRFVV